MDAAEVLRSARRRAGLDQRSFAALLEVPSGTLASWESGRRKAPAAALDAALAVVGLDLVLGPRIDSEDDASLKRHLRLSLSQRLRLGLGESPVLAATPRTAVWSELVSLARTRSVILYPPLATAIWLPIGPVEHPCVGVVGVVPSPGDELTVRAVIAPLPASLIPISMDGSRFVHVLPPAEMALPAAEQSLLRHAAALLHVQAPVDDAGRRRPAHRDPDERSEEWRLLVTKSMTGRQRPDPRDGRAWRLGASASLAQRLRHG